MLPLTLEIGGMPRPVNGEWTGIEVSLGVRMAVPMYVLLGGFDFERFGVKLLK